MTYTVYSELTWQNEILNLYDVLSVADPEIGPGTKGTMAPLDPMDQLLHNLDCTINKDPVSLSVLLKAWRVLSMLDGIQDIVLQ